MSNRHSVVEALEHGTLPHNLSWREVLEAIREIGEVERHEHGKVALDVGGLRLVVHPGSEHEVSETELVALRRFLRTARAATAQSSPTRQRPWVLTVDHHQARLYRFDADGGDRRFAPDDPRGFHRHLIHRREASYQGQRVPEDQTFYEAIVQAVREAPSLVILSDGTGKSNAARMLVGYARTHHREMQALFNDVREVDLSALRESDVVSIANAGSVPTDRGASDG